MWPVLSGCIPQHCAGNPPSTPPGPRGTPSLVTPLPGPLHLSPGIPDADQLLQAPSAFHLQGCGGKGAFQPGLEVLRPKASCSLSRGSESGL